MAPQATNSERLRQRLDQAVGARRSFRATVAGLAEPLWGCPLGLRGRMVAFFSMHDFRPRGVTLLSASRIRRLRRNAGDRAFDAMTAANNRLPARLPDIDLGDGTWRGALGGCMQSGAIVEIQRAGRDTTSLGTIEKLTERTVELRAFDEQGRFGSAPRAIPWQQVATLTTGTDYIGAYERLLASGLAPLPVGDLASLAGASDLDASVNDPASTRAALERAASTGQYVRLHRAFGSPAGGVVLAVGPELVLVQGIDELIPDPIEVFRLRDIERITSGPSEHTKTFLLRREGRLPAPLPSIDLSSISSVLASAGSLVTIEREQDGDFFLGKLLRRGKTRSRGQFLGIEGDWNEPEVIEHDDVTRIELASDYLRVFRNALLDA